MKVVEVRNMYITHKPSSRKSIFAKWTSMYVIKQIVRLITMKELKNAQSDVDLLTAESVQDALKYYKKNDNQNGQQGGKR